MRPIVVDGEAVKVARGGVRDVDTVLVEVGEQVPDPLLELARVSVAGRSQVLDGSAQVDVILPGDEVALLQLLTSRSEPADEADPVREADSVVLVGAWNGGGGATTTARNLARLTRAVLLDAAGNWGGELPLGDYLSWSDLVPSDLPPPWKLVSSLPRVGRVPILTVRTGVPLTPGDVLVREVADQLRRPTVIDCGTHLEQLFALAEQLEARGKKVRAVLTGTGTDRGAAALGRWRSSFQSEVEPLYLVTGRPHPMFHIVAERHGVSWSRAPRRAAPRAWRRTGERLWAA